METRTKYKCSTVKYESGHVKEDGINSGGRGRNEAFRVNGE